MRRRKIKKLWWRFLNGIDSYRRSKPPADYRNTGWLSSR